MTGGGDSGLALDLAPELAGSVMGVGNMIGNVGAVIATQLVSINRNANVSFPCWKNRFLMSWNMNWSL